MVRVIFGDLKTVRGGSEFPVTVDVFMKTDKVFVENTVYTVLRSLFAERADRWGVVAKLS